MALSTFSCGFSSLRHALPRNPSARRSSVGGGRPLRRQLVTSAASGKIEADKSVHTKVVPLPTPTSEKGSSGNGGFGPVPTILIAGVAAYGVYQVITSWTQVLKKKEKDPDVQQQIDLVEFAQSDVIDELFEAFDSNKDGKVDLAELAVGLRKYKPDASSDAVRASALDVLLLFDQNDNRRLERDEFKAFIQSWCLGTGTEFRELTEQLKHRLADKNFLAEEVHQDVQDFDNASPEELEAMLERHKLQAIFRLWDTDQDGLVDQQVLEHALKRLVNMASSELPREKKESINEYLDVMESTSYIAGQTVDQELVPNLTGATPLTRRHLTPAQFVTFVQSFQQISGLPRSQITDYLVVLPVYKKTAAEGKQLPKQVQGMERVLREHEVLSPSA